MENKILLLIFSIVTLITLTACNKGDYSADIVSFKYSYGGYNSGYYSYNINVDNEKTMFSAAGSNGVELNIDKEIDNSYLNQLSKIINKNDIYKWDGFNKSDEHVLDGNSFNIEVIYSDGKTIKSSGYMKYPSNYEKGHEALVKFLEGIK